jgi:N6-adenosine-specific RNA methylase IME4
MGGKGPEAHYTTAPVSKLGALPVAQVAAPGAWLFMWTTFPMLAAGDATSWRGLVGSR